MIRAAIAIAALSSACGIAFDDEAPTRDVAQAVTNGSCPAWMCGMNSPVIDNRGFHELNLDHLPELESGLKFVAFTQGGLEYQLHVEGDTIYGTRDSVKLEGTALIGAEIEIANGSLAFVIRITDVGSTTYWAHLPNGSQPAVQTYTLQWVHAGDIKWQDLCANPPPAEGWDTLNMDTHASIVFAGERVDATAKTIGAPDNRWFDIGCAGSTLAKLHLTGRTEAAQAAGFSSKIGARQTMLKMLSADYCGGGIPFTVAGMPLAWADDAGAMKVAGAAKLEARWDETGATCLVKPRVAVNPTPLAKATFPDIGGAIQAACPPIPACTDPTLATTTPLLSANPVIITLPPIHLPPLVHP